MPGFAQVSAPVLVAGRVRPGRFPDGAGFKSFVGLAPRASQTGETDRKGQPTSRARPPLLRATFVRVADPPENKIPSSRGSTTCG